MVNARAAGDAVGATKMDRPEDVEPSPRTGKVYCALTGNESRKPEQVDKANPRPANKYGHILEITEDGGDHAGTRFRWEILVLGGDPEGRQPRRRLPGAPDVSPMAVPDNFAFDDQGRLWVATDGMDDTLGPNDAVFMVDTEGPLRGRAPPVPVGPDRSRGLRAGLHAGQPDLLRGDAAPRTHRQGDLRQSGKPVARQPVGHAAPAERRRDLPDRRREGRWIGASSRARAGISPGGGHVGLRKWRRLEGGLRTAARHLAAGAEDPSAPDAVRRPRQPSPYPAHGRAALPAPRASRAALLQ